MKFDGASGAWARDQRASGDADLITLGALRSALLDPVDAPVVARLGEQIELEPLAHHARQEAADRVGLVIPRISGAA